MLLRNHLTFQSLGYDSNPGQRGELIQQYCRRGLRRASRGFKRDGHRGTEAPTEFELQGRPIHFQFFIRTVRDIGPLGMTPSPFE